MSSHDHAEIHPSGKATNPLDTTGVHGWAVSFKDLIAKIDKNDAPRWMVAKDGLDHGPFSGRELVAMIVRGDARGEQMLTNLDTGVRSTLEEDPLFAEFVTHYEERQQEAAHEAAKARAVRVEKFGNAAKIGIAVGVVAVIVLGIVFYLNSRSNERASEKGVEDLAALYERGQIRLEGTANINRAGKGRGARRGKGAGGAAGGALSYDEAMNQGVDLGDLSGSMTQLSSGQVAAVMNQNLNLLRGCVASELRSGQKPGNVRIDLAILGSGAVQGVSVQAGSAEFQRCVTSQVRKVRFPSFSSPRMGATFAFNVN